ncbi:MAG TPA: YhjD/YihY/BrkB family envelope integrity protein [Actinomycetota bacterium]|nr:YhjD/YihY/BrkB family envelope integrity protein [Actinomycetota bacterium]
MIARTRDRVTRTWASVLAARPRIPALDAAFDVGERDRDVAGGLLAGAVAFRLFLWLVPFALVAVTIAGWVAADTDLSTDDLARRFGIVGVAAQYVNDASKESTTTLVVILVIALYALLLASRSAVRAIRLAHLLAWRMRIVRFHGSTVAALWFAGGAAGLAAAAGVINTVRARNPGPGFLLWLVLIVIYGVVWLAASRALPHPSDVPVRALVPGAVVFALGTEVLHVLTVVWYANRLEHRSELYGGLGAAVVLLAWLYLLGRLAITSAVVNASLWRRSHPAADDEPGGEAPGVGFGPDG